MMDSKKQSSISTDYKTAATYEGFTITLALVDAIPCIFFAIGSLYIASKLQTPIFYVGAILATVAGFGKVAWKIVLALAKKDLPFLFKQMRICMPLGFLLMVIGIILKRAVIDFYSILMAMVSFPAIIFLLLGLVAMTGMILMAKHMDQNDSSSNWKEQVTNCVAQGAFMMVVLLAI